MALPKKTSRTILIDEVIYRWTVGPNKGFSVFIAQKEGVDGQMIKVYFETDIDAFWIAFPCVSHLNLKVLTPKDAAAIIRQAIQLGWNPTAKGAPMQFDWALKQLLVRADKA